MSSSSNSNTPDTSSTAGTTAAKSRWSRMGAAVRRSSTLLQKTSKEGTSSSSFASASASAPASASRPPTPSQNPSTESLTLSRAPSRTNSLLNFRSKSDTKQKGDSSTSGGKQKIDTTPATLNRYVSSAALETIPTAIPETPREALVGDETTRATGGAAVPPGLSPIVQQPSTSASVSTRPVTEVSTRPPTRPSTPPPPPLNLNQTQENRDMDPLSPQGYVPPPLLDSTAGNPGAFTDDPDTLPQPVIANDPFASSSRDLTNDHRNTKEEEFFVESPQSEVISAREPEKPFFDKPMVKGFDTDSASEFAAAVESNAALHASSPVVSRQVSNQPSSVQVSRQPSSQQLPRSHSPVFGAQVMSFPQPPSTTAPRGDDHLPSHHEAFSGAYVPTFSTAPTPVPVPQGSSAAPVFSLDGHDPTFGSDVWSLPNPHDKKENPVERKGGEERRAPAPAVKTTTLSKEERVVDMPPRLVVGHEREYGSGRQPSPSRTQPPVLNDDDVERNAVSMPLPAFGDVIPARVVRQRRPSGSLSVGRHETNERSPLLAGGSKPNYGRNDTFNLDSPTGNVVFPTTKPGDSTSNAPWAPPTKTHHATPPRLQELGWLEYCLPDGSFYYLHPTRKVVTDLDLRLEPVLADVVGWVEVEFGEGVGVGFGRGSRYGGGGGAAAAGNGYGYGYGGTSANGNGNGNGKAADTSGVETPGVEVWLRQPAKKSKNRRFDPVKCYVDHFARTVVFEGRGKAKAGMEDQLDMEYRYWSFIETHPAHTTLPMTAKAEALDALTWAWTDRLLPSPHGVPAPFSQEECQELMRLLRHFGADNPDGHGIHNRIVARIHLRIALWRQKYFRPKKALPKDISLAPLALPTRQRPLHRTLLDWIVGFMCLGLPYLFLERSRAGLGREHGTLGAPIRGVGAMFAIAACTCIMAAIILSASISFLSLQGLEMVPRVAVLVAIISATLAMVSTILAVFKHKSDIQRAGTVLDYEGTIGLTMRSVILSLPLVFLCYAIVGFVTAIVVHAIRGGFTVGPSFNLQSAVESGARWPLFAGFVAVGAVALAAFGSRSSR